MSVRSEKTPNAPLNLSEQMQNEITAAQPADSHLAEGASYQTANSENPLHRTVVVSVRSSLNELCLQKTKGTWSPSSEALKSIFQQKRYTALDGSAEVQGDLKVSFSTTGSNSHTQNSAKVDSSSMSGNNMWMSFTVQYPYSQAVVLHSMDVSHVKSTFPISLGARISGVDDATYTSTGESFSHVILPNSESSASKKLQVWMLSSCLEIMPYSTRNHTSLTLFGV